MSHYRTGEICGTDGCDSNRWINNGNGTQSCENGHVQQRYEDENDDDYRNIGDTTTRKRERLKRVSRSKWPRINSTDIWMATMLRFQSSGWQKAEKSDDSLPPVDSTETNLVA